MKCKGGTPAVPDLSPYGQTLLSQALRPGHLALTEGKQRCKPGAVRNPVPITESGDDRLCLLEPVTNGLDRRRISQGEPIESGRRLDEGGSYPEVVACFPKEQQRLLIESWHPG